MKANAYALVLAGGGGTRLWPASRKVRPKQFLPLLPGGETLLGATVKRLSPIVSMDRIFIITAAEQAEKVARLLPELPTEQIICEPVARNTAACIGLGALMVEQIDPDALCAVIPSDQFASDTAAYEQAIADGLTLAKLGLVGTIGIRPSRPETGFGYIRYRAQTRVGPGFAVDEFVEKPDVQTALSYIAAGNYLWNSGMFFFTARRLGEHYSRHLPELRALLEKIAADSSQLAVLYPAMPAVSIDFGLIEKLDASALAVIPADLGWSDVGAWTALAELGQLDGQGNIKLGDATAIDASNNILYADRGETIAVLGVSDLIVAVSDGAVLVLPKGRAQEVRRVIEQLKGANKDVL